MERIRCRRCLFEDMDDPDAVSAVKNYIEAMKADDKASDDVYRSRLESCRSCDRLLNGTCLECGCFVEIRAAHRNAECPADSDRWQKR